MEKNLQVEGPYWALWNDDIKAIILDQDHYNGHVKVLTYLCFHSNSSVSFLFSFLIKCSTNFSLFVLLQDHPKDGEFLNTPIRFYDQMEAIFGGSMAIGRFALGSNEALGVNNNTIDSAAGKMEDTLVGLLVDEKAEHGERSKAT